jgi:hypothetical protein
MRERDGCLPLGGPRDKLVARTAQRGENNIFEIMREKRPRVIEAPGCFALHQDKTEGGQYDGGGGPHPHSNLLGPFTTSSGGMPARWPPSAESTSGTRVDLMMYR